MRNTWTPLGFFDASNSSRPGVYIAVMLFISFFFFLLVIFKFCLPFTMFLPCFLLLSLNPWRFHCTFFFNCQGVQLTPMALTKRALYKGPVASPSFCPVTQLHPLNPCGVHIPNGIVVGWTLGGRTIWGWRRGETWESVWFLLMLVLICDDGRWSKGWHSGNSSST